MLVDTDVSVIILPRPINKDNIVLYLCQLKRAGHKTNISLSDLMDMDEYFNSACAQENLIPFYCLGQKKSLIKCRKIHKSSDICRNSE